ncbi:MAG: FAD binding domain-containing protein [Chloroflexi bacterium]|nr:FAD binding domain-containing protein [Chloroflexota bacterium]
MKPFGYARPRSVAEATRLLGDDAVAIAGGTDQLGLMKSGIAVPERLVSLSGLTDLDGWTRERGKGLRIGALTPLTDLETSAGFARILPVVPQALALAATPQLRTMGTVGGNLLQKTRCWYYRDEAFPCWLKGGTRCFALEGDNRHHAVLGAEECVSASPSDLAPALIAYDASVELRGARGGRTIALADLYQAPHGAKRAEHTIRATEVLTAVRIPEAALARRATFLKAMDRKAWSFAVVSVSVAARVRDGKARDVRIVLGGVAPIPWRARSAETILEGRALDDATCRAAADGAFADAEPLKDNGHKVTIGRELVRRALRSLADA